MVEGISHHPCPQLHTYAHMLSLGGCTVRCARAVRKAGCFPPPVATDPKVLNSAPYSPCWYTRDFLF